MDKNNKSVKCFPNNSNNLELLWVKSNTIIVTVACPHLLLPEKTHQSKVSVSILHSHCLRNTPKQKGGFMWLEVHIVTLIGISRSVDS